MNLSNVLASGTSVLDQATKTAITGGLADLGATVTDVVAITIPVAISVIALTAGVKYALKKVKGVINQAS